ncbi:MAG: M10 family metallopeptidase C-terminal domain-containing protein, partial [Pelodictyon phaeoclathratiforme]
NNTDGSLDTTFDLDGKVTTNFGAMASANSVVEQSGGKIIAVGDMVIDDSGGSDMVLVRYNEDGSLDTTFGNGGKVISDFGYGDFASSAVVQSDDKIIVAGRHYSNGGESGGEDFLLVRYNSNGTLDTTFDHDGIIIADFSGAEYPESVTLQTDGKIVVTGYSAPLGSSGDGDVIVVRYNTDGSLDSTFSDDGIIKTKVGDESSGNGVVVQSDGRILVAGNTDMNGDQDFLLVQYNSDGSLQMSSGSTESWLYLASYSDLMAAFGADSNAAAWHYNTYGKSEGRTLTFDAWGYLASYNDLRGAFGTDTGTAAKHYVEYGANEGRTVTFDAWGYLASYNDLHGAFGTDTAAATRHYVEYGANEGREITFDAEGYLASYADLQAAFGTDTAAATRHYVEYGANEGRTILVMAAASGIESLSVAKTATEQPFDIIQDFTTGEDQIDLTGFDANSDLPGDQSFTGPLLGGSDPFTEAGQLRYDDTAEILYCNTDSDLEPEFAIELIGAPALEIADLLL